MPERELCVKLPQPLEAAPSRKSSSPGAVGISTSKLAQRQYCRENMTGGRRTSKPLYRTGHMLEHFSKQQKLEDGLSIALGWEQPPVHVRRCFRSKI